MPTTFQCPACAGTIEYTSNDQEMTCPYCGTAITTPGAASAATVIMPKPIAVEPVSDDSSGGAKTVIQQNTIKNSAEIIDEVKRSLREDDKNGAVRIFSKEFNVSMADAQASVDQIEIDMKHSGREAVPAPAPAPAPEPMPVPTPISAQQIPRSDILDATPVEEKKSNTTRNWIIGCSVAFVLFCCFCVILPLIGAAVSGQFNFNTSP